ncbi:MAG TPA: trypsin-like peptidase domain-containing protein [Gemmatimonadaceae bacterium]|nr:trypsin-like peptidase domain-containing protein [Gemmatimonadaceae bacterium]
MKTTPRVFLAAVLIGCSQQPETSSAQQAQTSPPPSVSQGRRTAITTAVAAVAPAVVTVQTAMVEHVTPDLISQMFGARPGVRVTPGLGTGFIVRGDGVIVTNAHVIAGADSISVMLRDGKIYPAKRLGADETNDVAVIKIDATDLPVVKIGNSSTLVVGEWSIAIGNPYGFLLGNSEPSVTAGVISGVSRNLVERGNAPQQYYDMIQTDAAINPGNSGGPLANADGEVIGVNSSIYSSSGGSVGLGFAIPINRVMRIVDDLLTHGSVRRPWVGVQLQQRSRNPRDLISAGAVVAEVHPGSPAAAAGIRGGDVITQLGGRTINNPYDWDAALLDLRVGETASISLRRGGRTLTVTPTIQDLPDVAASKVEVFRELELVTVTPAIQAQRQLAVREGALVFAVSRRVSEATGLRAGDVITWINQAAINTADEAKRALDYYSAGWIQMIFVRGGAQYQSPAFRIR